MKQGCTLSRIRAWLAWPLLALFVILILSSTGAQLHGRLLLLGDWMFGDYYLLRGDIPTPSCDVNPDIEGRIEALRQEASDSSGLDALLDDEPSFDEAAARQSLEGAQALCQEKHQLHAQSVERVTLGVRIFRLLELGVEFFTLFVFDYQRLFIILMLFLGGICATLGQHHISFRPIRTLFQHRVSHGVELVALAGFFLPSAYSFYTSKELSTNTGVYGFDGVIALGALVLSAVTLCRFFCPPAHVTESSTPSVEKAALLRQLGGALLCIPIYVFMMLISGVYFSFVEGHTTGLVIYVGQLFEQADMFLKVGLYIWLGMLLKRSRLGHQIFDLVRPFGFSPEIVSFLAVLLMAVPTAYTGASGIIIIAMGAVVYKELRDSGARPNLAMAATAMTGSSGVVLRPCLIIVIIAALNKDVVTADLYMWGGRVFVLSAVVLLVFLAVSNKNVWKMNAWGQVRTPFATAVRALIMPVSVLVLVALGYRFILDAKLDEISAPIILPIILLIILWFDGPATQAAQTTLHHDFAYRWRQFGGLIREASQESALHVGALLLLMAFSFTIGGVIERTEVVMILPETFQSVWACMAMLVVLLVLIGMVMDPFGAVVLVSGSIASVAYTNGIAPLHFWMVTLVAFELGYLSPPVALNHLLTRQVIGEQEARKAYESAVAAPTWWLRHERILLPMCVMAITLLITAFVPLLL